MLDKIVGGWTLTAIQHYRTGDALPFYDFNLNPGVIFTENFRPDHLAGVPNYQKSQGYDLVNGTTWINPAAFGDPPHTPGGVPFRPGNTPRFLDVYGPWQPSESVGVRKTFPIRESLSLEVRSDFNNMFNRTQRSDPVTDVSSPVFGRIVSVSGTRIIVLSGRLRF